MMNAISKITNPITVGFHGNGRSVVGFQAKSGAVSGDHRYPVLVRYTCRTARRSTMTVLTSRAVAIQSACVPRSGTRPQHGVGLGPLSRSPARRAGPCARHSCRLV